MNSLLLILAAFTQTFPVSGTATFTQPWQTSRVDIIGTGWNGTDKTGPALLFMPGAQDGLVLGSGDAFRATGGRIERVRVVRKGSGGTAIKFHAKSAAERPGETIIRDVLTCGLSDLQGGMPDNWDTGLLIDGGTLTDTNAAGIRRFRVEHFRAASCQAESIILRNVTHFSGDDIQIDQGTATRTPVMVVDGSRHVDLKVNLFGELHIRDSDNVRVDGYVQTLRVDAKCRGIHVTGVVGAVQIDSGAGVTLLCEVRK